MFVLQNAPMEPVELPGLTLSPLEADYRTARFDLILIMVEAEQGLSAMFEYSTDLFDAGTIARLAENFQVLLTGIVADPEEHIADLPLLTEVEHHQLLLEWNATETDYPRNKCVHELFEAQVKQTPDATALVSEDQHLTFRALNRRANQLAHYLRGLGVSPEVSVGICVERSLEMVVGLLGILKAGGAYVPLDPSYPAERLAFMLEDARVPVLLTQQRVVEKIPPHTTQTFCLDADWNAIVRQGQPPSDLLDENLLPGVRLNNLCYVIYTSGSTGRPKGVAIEHRSLLNLVFWHQRAFGITAADRATQLAGPAFDASVWEIWPYLATGASVHLPDEETRSHAPNLRDWLVAHGITVSFLPTPLAEAAVALAWPTTCGLRLLLTGGDYLHQMPPDGLAYGLVNNYGPTETTVVTTSGRVLPQSRQDDVPSIGHPIANTQVYMLDRHLHEVPVGVAGEVYIGGAGLARGYLNRPDFTAERFIPDPFSDMPGARLYKSGDLARWRADGSIEFLGRLDEQVKIRGYRIELGEIEVTLKQHPAMREAVVLADEVARVEGQREKQLVAYVMPEPGTGVTPGDLRRFLQGKLPGYMVPSAFVMLGTLPLKPTGNVTLRALPASDHTRPELSRTFVAPLTPTEESHATLWVQVLGLERVGIHDNFFELGGHSLLATRVISGVRATLQVEMPLRLLFEAPTVAGLASALLRDSTERVEIERAAQLLTSVTQLSEDEVDRLLAEKGLVA